MGGRSGGAGRSLTVNWDSSPANRDRAEKTAVRILENEANVQDEAVASARRSLDLSTTRYKGGVTSYLEVITAQSAALSG